MKTNKQSAKPRASTPFMMLVFAISLLLIWGYWQRDHSVLSSETGVGYLLGIIGGSMMLILLSYPLAKRWRWLQRRLAVRHWFRSHMLLGIIGPVAILFHCNFHFGSLNSSVALVCMLLVVGSGIIGRYLYGKVHMGLYGQKASAQVLVEIIVGQRQQLREIFVQHPDLSTNVDLLYDHFLSTDLNRLSLINALLASPRRWYYRRRFGWLLRRLRSARLKPIRRQATQTLNDYLEALRKLAQLKLFERFLSWWHILHIPIFFLMVITAIVHIWAVHRY